VRDAVRRWSASMNSCPCCTGEDHVVRRCWCCTPPAFPWSPKDVEIINVKEGRAPNATSGR
jgi:hypothetical protein